MQDYLRRTNFANIKQYISNNIEVEAHYKQQQNKMEKNELIKSIEELVGAKSSNFKYVRGFVEYKLKRKEGGKIEGLTKVEALKALEYFKTKHCVLSAEDVLSRLSYSVLSSEDLEKIKLELDKLIFDAEDREVGEEGRSLELEQDLIDQKIRRYEEKKRKVEERRKLKEEVKNVLEE